MTDEENEAIEYFRKREEICMENADICDENNFDEEATCLRKEHILIETLLNLIEKQDNIIKGNECVIETQANNEKVLSEAIEKKDKIINRIVDMFITIAADKPATIFKYLEKDGLNTNRCLNCSSERSCKNCIIEYFEKKER